MLTDRSYFKGSILIPDADTTSPDPNRSGHKHIFVKQLNGKTMKERELIILDPNKVHQLGRALPYGGLKSIEKKTGLAYTAVRDTFQTVRPQGYDKECIEIAIRAYNSRLAPGASEITVADLKNE